MFSFSGWIWLITGTIFLTAIGIVVVVLWFQTIEQSNHSTRIGRALGRLWWRHQLTAVSQESLEWNDDMELTPIRESRSATETSYVDTHQVGIEEERETTAGEDVNPAGGDVNPIGGEKGGDNPERQIEEVEKEEEEEEEEKETSMGGSKNPVVGEGEDQDASPKKEEDVWIGDVKRKPPRKRSLRKRKKAPRPPSDQRDVTAVIIHSPPFHQFKSAETSFTSTKTSSMDTKPQLSEKRGKKSSSEEAAKDDDDDDAMKGAVGGMALSDMSTTVGISMGDCRK